MYYNKMHISPGEKECLTGAKGAEKRGWEGV